MVVATPKLNGGVVGKQTWTKQKRSRFWQGVLVAISLLLMAIAIWLDVVGSFWQETVILSGIAAGLLTFVLTAAFVERWMAQREHLKWIPVTRLALSDMLHSLADEDRSSVRRGDVVVRTLSLPTTPTLEQYDELLHQVVKERDSLTDALARWASFLVASADVQELMLHVARVSESLDDVRDSIVEAERLGADSPAGLAQVRQEIQDYNSAATMLVAEIESVLSQLESVEETAP